MKLIVAKRRRLESLSHKASIKTKIELVGKESYKPWIRVQDVSSHGNSGMIDGIKINRIHHTLSEHGFSFFYLASVRLFNRYLRTISLITIRLIGKNSSTIGCHHPIIVRSKSNEFNVIVRTAEKPDIETN